LFLCHYTSLFLIFTILLFIWQYRYLGVALTVTAFAKIVILTKNRGNPKILTNENAKNISRNNAF